MLIALSCLSFAFQMASPVWWVWLHWKFSGRFFYATTAVCCLISNRFTRWGRHPGESGHRTAQLSEGPTISATTRAEAASVCWADNFKIHTLLPAPSSWVFHRNSAFKSKYSRCHQSKVLKESNTLCCICLCHGILLAQGRTLSLKHSAKTRVVQKAQVTTLSWATKLAIWLSLRVAHII